MLAPVLQLRSFCASRVPSLQWILVLERAAEEGERQCQSSGVDPSVILRVLAMRAMAKVTREYLCVCLHNRGFSWVQATERVLACAASLEMWLLALVGGSCGDVPSALKRLSVTNSVGSWTHVSSKTGAAQV